jgi:acetylornithine/succinyldiaminopimelate/putrescine aminotransferase
MKIIEQESKPKMSSSKSHVFGRAKEGALPKVQKAEGLWIEDDRGNRYLNASGGAAVTNVGHGRREIAEALISRFCSTTIFTRPLLSRRWLRTWQPLWHAAHRKESIVFIFFRVAAKRLRHPSRWPGRSISQMGGPRESGLFLAGNHIMA